jgi:hypothetical protein
VAVEVRVEAGREVEVPVAVAGATPGCRVGRHAAGRRTERTAVGISRAKWAFFTETAPDGNRSKTFEQLEGM